MKGIKAMQVIHCLNNISEKGTSLFTDEYTLSDDLSQATGILVRSAALHDTEFPEQLLSIARAGAGVNNIPLDRCAEEGIVVFNTPGANANAVKELVLCGLFLGSRGIIGGAEWCRENADNDNITKDAEKAKKQFGGHEILGKKLGVIGLGAIGAMVANAAVDLGMDVYGYDPYVSVGAAWRIDSAVHHVTELNDLLKECDYITIHVPAVEGTIGMINKEACDIMKNGVVFLNFSRETLVDEAAMAEALESGKVATYITDFATPAVMKMPNTIALPHLGASTEEAEENCAIMAVNQTMDYLENGSIVNSVNYPNTPLSSCAGNGTRVAILHENIPNTISKFAGFFGDVDINIDNLINGARGNNAYTVIDLAVPAPENTVEALSAVSGVRLVRIL